MFDVFEWSQKQFESQTKKLKHYVQPFCVLGESNFKTRIENGTTIQTFERRKIVNGTSVFVAVGQVKTISMWVNSFEAVSKQFQNHCETILNCFGKESDLNKKNQKTYFGTEDAFLEG